MSTFKPLRNICLCELLESVESDTIDLSQVSSKSGVALRARVVEAGPGRLSSEGVFIENTVKHGDIIYFSSVHETSEFPFNNNQVLVAEHNILAIED